MRADQVSSSRYRWLSTPDTDYRVGGAGRPTLWITEGPLKAEVASCRLSTPVIGVANWRKAVFEGDPACESDAGLQNVEAVERNLAEFREALQALPLG